jgi:transposase
VYTGGTTAGVLEPLLETIASLSTRVRHYDRELERLAREHYPETELLRQVQGVGALTALTFVLTLEEPGRFEESRSVGAYLGLVPSKDQAGERDPQMRISREGDEMLRRLLVGSAHYILSPFGEDCDLRRQGLKIAWGAAAKDARKRAVVAVARKLSVLLHHLGISGEVYEPLYNSRRPRDRAA